MKIFTFILSIASLLLSSCQSKEEVDLLVINAKAYTVDADFTTAEAFAVTDGKIVDLGSTSDLSSKYTAKETLDAEQKTILPGLIDAHAHLYNLGLKLSRVDLDGTVSYKDVVSRVQEFKKKFPETEYIIGRGWDQNDWAINEFPTKDTLDLLFPNTPVALTRIDGHAMIVNQKAFDKANINESTPVFGGEIVQNNGKLTGILIDNPMAKIRITFPELDKAAKITALKSAEDIAISLGLTSLVDAGLNSDVIHLIDDLQNAGDLKMRIYAMIRNNEENISEFLESGILKTDRLNVRSVKVYADGALGSRGAALKEPYSDKEDHFGSMIIDLNDFKTLAARLYNSEFQMNTHAIGDSANSVVLKTYDSLLQNDENRRWRVEHAQVMDDRDFKYFDGENIIPSVQPTHATSDMYWAEDRLGEQRTGFAYAYKTLLDNAGKVALGTDFPIENVNPFLTFYAAVARQDLENYPEGGFNPDEKLSREETLKGMTIWAAYANFEDQEKGSLELGKFADFILVDQDPMKVELNKIPVTKVLSTYIGGEKVYSLN
ncbi:amidohydrolase [Psychroflexus sp. MES1-P1E]|uniref:amidohydrolase n=1 Tax=Psychroflexus sp. MES1-P1E TaxID=2058320 RepID=UPI000C7B4BAE|nr:amidohydrolase [Psychroflexus sp. MES1-P1E]PKG41515.1 amidohydrolase [Psychroflexus sp. MES1-P1E]